MTFALPSNAVLSIARRAFLTKSRSLSYLTALSFKAKPEYSDQPPPLFKLPDDSPILKWKRECLSDKGFSPDAGEDAAFLQLAGAHGNTVLGVADGVGGWASQRIDPSIFSSALCYYASRHALKTSDAFEILNNAYKDVQRDRHIVAGSATACIVSLAKNGAMDAINLGDSSFVILRDTKVIYSQPSQQYYFNCPRQLAKMPKRWVEPGSIDDTPNDADRVRSNVQQGDVIIIGTDGIFDNCFPTDIERVLSHLGPVEYTEEFVQDLASNIVAASWHYANQVDRQSPFEVEALKSGINRLQGGKVDDMSVAIALVAP